MNSRFCSAHMGSSADRSDLQAKFLQIQALTGADECRKAMCDVRGRHGQRQEGGEGEAVADTAGGRQTYQ